MTDETAFPPTRGDLALDILRKIARGGAENYAEVEGSHATLDLHLDDLTPEESALLGELLDKARDDADDAYALRMAQERAVRGIRVRPGPENRRKR